MQHHSGCQVEQRDGNISTPGIAGGSGDAMASAHRVKQRRVVPSLPVLHFIQRPGSIQTPGLQLRHVVQDF